MLAENSLLRINLIHQHGAICRVRNLASSNSADGHLYLQQGAHEHTKGQACTCEGSKCKH